MSPLTPPRLLLALQAAVTAGGAVTGRPGGWTYVALLLAAAAVFVAGAVQPEPVWRACALGFEVGSVVLGLAALAGGHAAPGAVVALLGAVWLAGPAGGRAFTGVPAVPLELGPAVAPAPVMDVLPSR